MTIWKKIAPGQTKTIHKFSDACWKKDWWVIKVKKTKDDQHPTIGYRDSCKNYNSMNIEISEDQKGVEMNVTCGK